MRTNSLTALDETGQQLSRTRLLLPRGATVADMQVVNDSTVVAALERVSLDPMPDALTMVVTLDPRSGVVRDSIIAEPAMGLVNASTYLRRKATCVRPLSTSSLLLVLNDWLFEGVGIELGTGTERFHFATHVPLEPRHATSGYWVPGGFLAGVECGESVAFFKLSKPGFGSASGPTISETFFEARGYDGGLLARRRISEANSILHGMLADARGDTLFVISNKGHEFPVVAEFVFRKGANQ